MTVRILTGDCRDVLRTLPDQSAHCCVASPPYFGLRDYGVAGQMGLESTPDEYIAGMVEVFREVRRVLRDDATMWLNIGDSYASSGRGGNPTKESSTLEGTLGNQDASIIARARGPFDGFKQKDLMGIPWMLAFALRADGWYLRQDIIWSKPNPMPESVRDRCTKAHEYLFLLSKSPRYYFDAGAIAEVLAPASIQRLAQPNLPNQAGSDRVPGKTNGTMKAVGPRFGGNKYGDDDSEQTRTKSGDEWAGASKRYSFARESKDSAGEHGQKPQHRADRESVDYCGKRNKRSVWTIATQPFKEAHFATFPPALVEPCILAGTSERGCCATCGAPWTRITSKPFSAHDGETESAYAEGSTANRLARLRQAARERGEEYSAQRETLGWEPTCECGAELAPCKVLDPFGGAGTTGLVADRLQRDAILIELNPEYTQIARKRITADAPLFAAGGA